jgi:hypothetical protein
VGTRLGATYLRIANAFSWKRPLDGVHAMRLDAALRCVDACAAQGTTATCEHCLRHLQ